MSDKPQKLSTFDTEKIYQLNDTVPFDVGATVVNNDILVQVSDGSIRDEGLYSGRTGRQADNLYIDADGKLIQENNNGLPDDVFDKIKFDYNIGLDVIQDSQFGSFSELAELTSSPFFSKQLQDTTTFTNPATSNQFKYVVPNTLTWVGNSEGLTTATTTEGLTITSNSIWSNSYDLKSVVDRAVTGNGFLWNSAGGVGPMYLTIALPTANLISGIHFVNQRTDFATTSFVVAVSMDNINFTDIVTVTGIGSDLLASYIREFTPILAKYIRLKPLTIIGSAGSVGRFDVLYSGSASETLLFKPLIADERYFELTETPSEVVLSTKAVAGASSGGELLWSKYSKFQQRSSGTGAVSGQVLATTGTLRNLNTVVHNNLGLDHFYSNIILPPGEYYIRAAANTYYTFETVLQLTDNTGEILLNGTHTFVNNTAATSTTTTNIEGTIRILSTTTIQLRQSNRTTSTTLNSQGFGYTVPGISDFNVHAELEIWKTKELAELISSDALDTHWNNVKLLVNGDATYADGSDYSTPNTAYGTVTESAGKYGNGLLLGTTPSFIYTMPVRHLLINSQDFAIECWIKFTNLSAATNPVFGNSLSYTVAQGFRVAVTSAGAVQFSSNNVNYIVTIDGKIALGIWYHIALSRAQSTVRLFIDGILVGTTSISTVFNQSRQIQFGKDTSNVTSSAATISDARVTIGSARYTDYFDPPVQKLTKYVVDLPFSRGGLDPYYQNVIFLLNGINGAVDESLFHSPVTSSGSTINIGPHGNVYSLSGIASRLSVPQAVAIGGFADFTAETWYRRNAGGSDAQCILNVGVYGTAGSYSLFTFASGLMRVYANATGVIAINQTDHNQNLATWNHFALIRRNNIIIVFINGKMISSSELRAETVPPTTVSIGVHDTYNNSADYSDARVTVGVARYTSHYIPPTVPVHKDYIDQFSSAKYGDTLWKDVGIYPQLRTIGVVDSTFYGVMPTYNTTTRMTKVPGPLGIAEVMVTDHTLTNQTSTYFFPSWLPSTTKNSDFSVECWFFPKSGQQTSPVLLANSDASGSFTQSWRLVARYSWSPTKFAFLASQHSGSAALLTSITDVQNDQWYHIAVTKKGTSWYLFINGVLEHTVTSSIVVSNQLLASHFWVGGIPVSNTAAGGYIANPRVTQTARYVSNFTPTFDTPEEPSVAHNDIYWDNVTLLLNFENLIDQSNYGNKLTTTAVLGEGKFGQGLVLASAATTATTNYPMLIDDMDITVEFWIKTSGTGAQQIIASSTYPAITTWAIQFDSGNTLFLRYGTGASAIGIMSASGLNFTTWTHVAWTRQSRMNRFFINGVRVASAVDNVKFSGTAVIISNGTRPLVGNVDDVRITNGKCRYNSTGFTIPSTALSKDYVDVINPANTGPDPYWNNVGLLLNFENLSDSSNAGNVITTNGTLSTGRFGQGLALAAGQAATTSVSNPIGTSDITVEFWIRLTSTATQQIIGTPSYPALNSWCIQTTTASTVLLAAGNGSGASVIVTSSGHDFTKWTHIAWVRSAGTSRLYVNGLMVITGTDTRSYITSTVEISDATLPIIGTIDDVRITYNTARYSTGGFIVPSVPLSQNYRDINE